MTSAKTLLSVGLSMGLSAGVLATLTAPGAGPTREPPARAVAVLITLRGELDHASQIEDLRRALSEAKEGGTTLIGVEIAGTRWRYDLLRSLSDLVSTHEPPVAVWTSSGSLGVAVGAARAGAGCWAPAGTLTLSKDDNTVELASTPREVVDASRAWVANDAWSVLSSHPALRASMLDLRKGSWLVERTGQPREVRNQAPAPGDAMRVVPLVDAAAERLELSTSDAIMLGVLAGEARDLRSAVITSTIRAGSARVEIRRTRITGTSLEDRHAEATALLESIDPILDQAESEQRLRVQDTTVAPATKNAAGRQSLATLARAGVAIEALESGLNKTPEILRLPAPGQTTTVQRRSTHASSWRSQIQGLRDRRDRLADHAEQLRDAR